MELILAHQNDTQISVSCDGQFSHTFELPHLLLSDEAELFNNPIAYGQKLFEVLFPPNTPAQGIYADLPERLLLVTADDLDAVPWEYAYGPKGFLVLDCHFLRGLPREHRVIPPKLDTGLHIVTVPSNPLNRQLKPLNIEGEWVRLKEVIQELPYSITLERTRPPTPERLRHLVANQKNRIIHFMGHGGQDEKEGAILCFEQDNGDLNLMTANDFIRRVRDTVFLVTLNACVSATPGETHFSNLAASLVRQKTPYALGMRFSIPDDDARAFSRTFYSDLARGSSVEEALLQARLTLANSPHPWIVGVPVLYTSLMEPAASFASLAGSPIIKEHRPLMEVSALPHAEGAFQGRNDELKALGTALTGDNRPPIITIHGGGGQGKTALAREVAERFAYAWPGGVWAISLENLPSREVFVTDLARFLGIDTQKVPDSNEVERLVTAQLVHRRTLLILDNAETLVEAVETGKEEALRLAQFIRERLPRPPVSLLATSRSFLGWAGEVGYELTGLSPIEGVRLFQQYVPQREGEIDQAVVWELSEKVEGHPLSLQLLGSTFNASTLLLAAFAKEYEAELLNAENKYKDLDHRQRTLYASIETSVRYLDVDLARLFGGLWLFHAPFLPDRAAAIFDPQTEDAKGERSPIYDRLYALWQHSLLARETATLREGTVQFYRLLPTMRPYIEKYLQLVDEREYLLAQFGKAYADLARFLYSDINSGAVASFIASQSREDLDRGASCISGVAQGHYLHSWGWIQHRMGNPQRGLPLLEQALEIAQEHEGKLKLQVLNSIAVVYEDIGEPQRALELLEQALTITREVGDREGVAATLNNMAGVYNATGEPQWALELYEQALPLMREVRNRAGEATTLNNIAEVYRATGQPQRALELYEQALPLMREVRNRAGEATTLTNIAEVYRTTGQPQRALELYEQALPIRREVGDRAGEAITLNNIAEVYRATGQPQRALELYERNLPLMQEVGNRSGEARTLNNMALVYGATGQPQQALELFEQALPLMREVRDRAMEASTLTNIAEVYRTTGQPQRALELLEQALPITREVRDRAGEARTLNNMALVYRATGYPQQALDLYEQALPLMREVGNRAMEATILNNLALEYRATGQLQRALELYEQVLPITREVGNRTMEATTLNNIAEVYRTTGQSQRALELLKQALPIRREVGDRAGEAATLDNMAEMCRDAGQPQLALELLEQALSIRQEVGDQAGKATTLNNLAQVYHVMSKAQQALELLEQALSIRRELGDRAGVVRAINNLALVYSATGQPQQALEMYEQGLPLIQEVGDRAEVATFLINLAEEYRTTGQPQRALALLEQALPIRQEVGDRAGEATTLNNMAKMYYATGQLQRALVLYEQALPLMREMGDRAGEATTLNNIAGVYGATGQLQRALELFEQALPLMREMGDRAMEATILNNMAEVYRMTGQQQRALELFEQALPIRQEVGDRAGEATTLNNMAGMYHATGQPQRALVLFEQVLSIRREVGDRAGEATTLNNKAEVYRTSGQLQKAMELYEQALPLMREVGDRAGEATTLNNMALVYQMTGQPQRALELFEQALPIRREVGDRAGEAVTLNNLAVYYMMGKPQQAMELLEQALPIRREVGDRAGEAATLHNLGVVYRETGHPQRALELLEQALPIRREVRDRAGEATTLANIADTLYRYLNRPQEAIAKMEQAIAVLVETGLLQDAAGQTRDQLQQYLDVMLRSPSPDQAFTSSAHLSAAQIQQIITNTVTVMTTVHESRAEWRKVIANALQQAQQQGANWQIEVDLFTAILALLDRQPPALPSNHLYAPVMVKIQDGISATALADDDSHQDNDLSIDAELIPRSITALSGGPKEKMAHVQYLTAMSSQTKNEELKSLLQAIQLGLFGGNLSQLGQNLSGAYRDAWDTIIMGVEAGGVDPRMFAMIVRNTLVVLGPAKESRGEWRSALTQMRSQMEEGESQNIVALLDAVIGLLDAGGNPDGLGANLTGIYERTWQAIVEQLV